MQKTIFSALFLLLGLSASSQYMPAPKTDTLKQLYEEKAIHLSNWGMYQKNGSYYNNGFLMNNLKRELSISTDALELFKKGRNMQLAGAGTILAGSTLMVVGSIIAFSFGQNSTILTAGTLLGGAVVVVGGSIVIGIGDFKIRKAVDYYNRDILLNAIGSR